MKRERRTKKKPACRKRETSVKHQESDLIEGLAKVLKEGGDVKELLGMVLSAIEVVKWDEEVRGGMDDKKRALFELSEFLVERTWYEIWMLEEKMKEVRGDEGACE